MHYDASSTSASATVITIYFLIITRTRANPYTIYSTY